MEINQEYIIKRIQTRINALKKRLTNGLWKRDSYRERNIWGDTMIELQVALSLNLNNPNQMWLPTCLLKSKKTQKDYQFDGYDIILLNSDGSLPVNPYGIDVKHQPMAGRYGTVNVEYHRQVRGRMEKNTSWLFTNKAQYVAYVVQDKVYLLELKQLRQYYDEHKPELRDNRYDTIFKQTYRLPINDINGLKFMSIREYSLPIEAMQTMYDYEERLWDTDYRENEHIERNKTIVRLQNEQQST